MSNWQEVPGASRLAEGEHLIIELDGSDVAVFKIDGEFYAIEDACTHDGAEIASGCLEGDEIICPRHGARFCLKTGEVKAPPAYENVHIFPLRSNHEKLEIRDDRWD